MGQGILVCKKLTHTIHSGYCARPIVKMSTIPELKALLKEKGVKGYSGKNKAELEAMLATAASPAVAEDMDASSEVMTVDVVMLPTAGDILSVNSWKNTKVFQSIKDKETQRQYYRRMNSCAEVLQLVDLDSKPFGTESEKIIGEIFNLGPRTSTQNDGTRHGEKIEIKCARYWGSKDECKWQHLEPDHDYGVALLAILDFHGWKVWAIKKSLLMGELRDKKIVTYQGKQGWWVCKSAILPYLTPIKTIAELDAFILS
jgi:hypothetical protein